LLRNGVLSMDFRMRNLIVAALALPLLAVAADSTPDVRALADEAKARREATTVKPFERPTYDEARIKQLAQEAQTKGRVELQRLREAQGAAIASAEDEGTAPAAPVKGRLVVALSSSMPEQMLKDYMAQLDGHPEAIVVLRGFVGGAQSVAPTGKLMERVMRKTSERNGGHHAVRSIVDPILYRQLGIDRVPAVAWLDGVQDISHCDQEDFDAAFVVYGATTVGAALKAAAAKGAKIPKDVVQRFNRG